MQPEKRIQNEILLTFGSRAWLRLWRVNVGVARTMDGRGVVRFGVPGMADLTGILACGRRLEVEVKSARGRVSQDQRAFGDVIERFGGVYTVARSCADLQRALDAHRSSCDTCAGVPDGTPTSSH